MTEFQVRHENGETVVVVGSIPTEDVLVRSQVEYVPQFVTDVYGRTKRVTKDVTLTRLLNWIRKEKPQYEIVSLGTPVNFDRAPTHLTRVEMEFNGEGQVEACLKEISVSDMLIRTRLQPAWDWQSPIRNAMSVILHVGWYDTVYYLQFKDIFLGQLHCRYSAKFGFDPRDARITHFRYNESGHLEEVERLNAAEEHANSIKDKVEFLRIFRDGAVETT